MKFFRKAMCLILSLAVCFSCIGISSGCSSGSFVAISEEEVSMGIFDKKTLSVETDVSATIRWYNSNENVVNLTKSQDGKTAELVALRTGVATITVKVGAQQATSQITVANKNNDKLEVELISLESEFLVVGESKQIEATATFKDQPFADANLEYELVNVVPVNCMQIDEDGLLTSTGAGNGKVKIRAEYLGVYSDYVQVSVNVRQLDIPATDVQISVGKTILDVSESIDISKVITPSNSTSPIEYVITKNGAATTDAKVENDRFIATKGGIYTVTAKIGELSSSVQITVPEYTLNIDSYIELFVEDAATGAYQSSTNVVPSFVVNGSSLSVNFETVQSMDENIAKFQDGRIIALGAGETTLIFPIKYQNITFYRNVIVSVKNEAPAATVQLVEKAVVVSNRDVSYDGKDMAIKTFQLSKPTVYRGTAIIQNPDIVWSITRGSANATITPSGLVTGVKHGEATATATWTDEYGGKHTANCSITVDAAVYYGQAENFSHNGIVADMYQYASLRIDDVSLTTEIESPLFRMQILPQGPTIDNTMFYITLTDSTDATNYINIAIRAELASSGYLTNPSNNGAHLMVRLGARANTFPLFEPDLSRRSTNSKVNYNQDAASFFSSGAADKAMGFGGGYAYGARASYSGLYLDGSTKMASNMTWENYMLSFSFVNNKLYLVKNASSLTQSSPANYAEIMDFSPAGMNNVITALNDEKGFYTRYNGTVYLQIGNLTTEHQWGGFKSNKVDISIRADRYNSNYGITTTIIMFDKLGGADVNANTVNNIYYQTGLSIW